MSYKTQVHNYTLNLGKQTDEAIRGALYQISNKIIKRTPVDTGRLRGNWMASIHRPRFTVKNATDKVGASTAAQVANDLTAMKFGMTFYLTNNLPYAERIEYGYSGQAPQGMVRTTIMEAQTELDEQSKKIR